MKDASRHTLKIAGLALVAVFGFAPAAQAQNKDKYVIHARAGGISSVSGDARVLRRGTEDPRGLITAEYLGAGDSVRTGAGGRVEILLNPGSYMRVGENASAEMVNASLDNLLVRLTGGSVIVEATGGDGVKLAIGVKTPQAEALIIKGGIYRFNVLPDGATEIVVRKGRLLLGQEEIKGERKVLVRGGLTEVAKLDKKQQDALDLWSKERAEELARANQRLRSSPLETAFNNLGLAARGRVNYMDSLGLWVYDAGTRTYCFIPLRSGAASSPYGYEYGTGFGNAWLPDESSRLASGERQVGAPQPSQRGRGSRPGGGATPRPRPQSATRGPRRD